MLTFQSVADEARKQKEVIVHSLYEKMKECHQHCHHYSVVAILNLSNAVPFSFCVNAATEIIYNDEPSENLFIISLVGFEKDYPSYQKQKKQEKKNPIFKRNKPKK